MARPDYDMLRNLMKRGEILEYDATGPQHVMRVSGLAGEELRDVVRAKSHGFSSYPPVGSDALILSPGGRPDKAMAIGVDHQDYGPRDLQSGHTAIYDANGNMVSLVGTQIRIVSGTKIVMQAPQIVLIGECHIGAEGGVPASRQGTIDTGGNADVSNLAAKVFLT